MSTRHRLQDNTVPTHYVETLYLTQILVAAQVMLFNLPQQDIIPITAQRLAEWPLVHRTQLCGCSIFTHDAETLLGHDELHDFHRQDVARIDIFIKALQQGLESGDVTKHVTPQDLQAIALTLPRLESCVPRTQWT